MSRRAAPKLPVDAPLPAVGPGSRVPRRRTGGGFALLIVVTLLAFLVVLLVGLAAYTQIETSIAGNTQRQAQARENALLALNVAVAQLQRYAGPDTRVTATAQAFGGVNGTRPYTGVWSADGATPLTWLVSGNEFRVADPNEGAGAGATVPAPLAVTPTSLPARNVELVGRNTLGTTTRTQFVAAPLADIRSRGVPGVALNAETVIGRYAWWVGDQGVKAPVAVPDSTSSVTYAPYNTTDPRARLRQHMALGGGAADTAGNPVFEPRDNNNSPLVAGHKVIAANQFSFLRNSGNAQLGLARAQQNFHAWSPNNYAVLANPKTGGLRQDLSLVPGRLGSAFSAWADYSSYMEPPVPVDPAVVPVEGAPPAAPTIFPDYGTDPLRRRYRMTPHLIADSGSHQVAPVLSYFLLSFNVRTKDSGQGSAVPFEVRARWMVSLWNPYTGALVPEDLRIEVSGLPSAVRVIKEVKAVGAGTSATDEPVGEFSLQDPRVFGSAQDGSPLLINLPWTTGATEQTTYADRQSWLPGRVYTWRSSDDSSRAEFPPETGYASEFYSQTLSNSGAGVIRPLALPTVDGNDQCRLEVEGAENLRITLYVMRPDGPVRIGAFISPAFVTSFATTPQEAYRTGYQFSYVFRLAESLDTPQAPGTWLNTTGRDVRRRTLPSEAYVVAELGNDPAQYGGNYATIRNPDRLLDRSVGSRSYNEDVPLFELPRAPLLSLGALQHFRLPGQRPFMIGNPWGANYELNGIRTAELFDRYFFSGLVAGVTPSVSSNGEILAPNSLLKPVRFWDPSLLGYRKPTIDDIRATVATVAPDAPTPAEGLSSKFFLQSGAFNLNSTNVAAWTTMLRGVRFPSPQTFRYLNVSSGTGTNGDTSTSTVQSTSAQFFRFSQSAHETYKADAGLANNDPEVVSPARTELFRRGMRTLTAAQVAALAGKIVEYVTLKHANEGPFKSMEDFISPSILFAGTDSTGVLSNPRSLLEAAIADARTSDEKGLNTDVAEIDANAPVQMNSQWLTQADILTALAPLLFPRSDTFIIRTYGEAVNPATSATEGRAWCEAVVQRVPEYFDRKDNDEDLAGDYAETPPDTLLSDLNRIHGRRFKVISFRWLTRSDI